MTEEEFTHLVKRSWLSRSWIASVGSCCLVGTITSDTLFVANLGDSRAVLGCRAVNDMTVVTERLSTDHNVSAEEVRKELVELHPDNEQIVIRTHGVWCVKGIIQVLRSIDDIYLKEPEFSRDSLFRQFISLVPLKRPIMIAEPSIHVRKLTPNDLFLIFASDGLWETPLIRTSMLQGITNEHGGGSPSELNQVEVHDGVVLLGHAGKLGGFLGLRKSRHAKIKEKGCKVRRRSKEYATAMSLSMSLVTKEGGGK
ncbi:putative protein phosphatase 2C 78 [Canna indica]|uniref:protein-serine/threonine phosphatase n=1 Tax=Canna indica TaxID=4628 RepID=A0AAQ3JZH5_9LILI|nr:putative protein phosphatase 2C 78 [Canna indica]